MNEENRSLPSSTEGVRDLGDLSAVRGALIGSLCGALLWALFGLVLALCLSPF